MVRYKYVEVFRFSMGRPAASATRPFQDKEGHSQGKARKWQACRARCVCQRSGMPQSDKKQTFAVCKF
jgi:hypothetical protein